jgi:hypothetical protein
LRAQPDRAFRLYSSNGFVLPQVLKKAVMREFLTYALVPIAVGAVAIVLLLGLGNMLRGGSPHTSQKLMRLRVLLQFVAIVVIMLTIWALRG